MTLRPRYPLLFFVALIASCLLWYALAGQKRERISVRSFKATLTLVNIPPTLHLVSPVPEPVTVQIRGPLSSTIDSRAPLEVLLDLSDAEPGRRSYSINDTDIQVPPSLTVVSVDPREITLELERLEIISLPVRARLEGNPSPGYVIAGVRVTPSQVRVQGPGSRLAELVQVDTFPLVIEGSTAETTATVQISLPSPLRSLHVGPVQVTVDIVPEPTPTPTPTAAPGRRR
jgi:YbbR domain-containing protein